MSKITIKDLPRDLAISKEEMRRVVGGAMAVLPQGEDLFKPGDVQLFGGFSRAFYMGTGPYGGGRTLYGGFSYYG